MVGPEREGKMEVVPLYIVGSPEAALEVVAPDWDKADYGKYSGLCLSPDLG